MNLREEAAPQSGWLFSFSISWAPHRHLTSPTSMMLSVVLLTRCRAFLSWAVMNHTICDVSSQNAFYCSSVKSTWHQNNIFLSFLEK